MAADEIGAWSGVNYHTLIPCVKKGYGTLASRTYPCVQFKLQSGFPLTESGDTCGASANVNWEREGPGLGPVTTIIDFSGRVVRCKPSELRFMGNRRVENLLRYTEDFSNAVWVGTNMTQTATSLTATAANATCLQTFTAEALAYAFTVDMKRVTGTGDVEITAGGGIYATPTLTTEWKRFAAIFTNTAGSKECGIRIVTSGDSIDVRNAQLELVGIQVNQDPGEYVSVDVVSAPAYHGAAVDGVKYFPWKNGNTVASNVVIPAQGDPIGTGDYCADSEGPWGCLIESVAQQITLHSEDFTQTWTNDLGAGVTMVSNATTAPDGRMTATSIKQISSTADGIQQVWEYPATNGEGMTYNIFVKNIDATTSKFEIYNDTDVRVESYIQINWSGATATLGTVSGVPGWSSSKYAAPRVVALPDNWYRVFWHDALSTTTGRVCRMKIQPEVGATSTTGIYIWGATMTRNPSTQAFEDNNYLHSTYMPVEDTADTKEGDELYYFFPVTTMSPFFGTLFAEIITFWQQGAIDGPYYIDCQFTSVYSTNIYLSCGGTLPWAYQLTLGRVAGSSQSSSGSNNPITAWIGEDFTAGTMCKIAGTWQFHYGTKAFKLDLTAESTLDNSPALNQALAAWTDESYGAISIGCRAGSGLDSTPAQKGYRFLNGCIRNLKILPVWSTFDDVQLLTPPIT